MFYGSDVAVLEKNMRPALKVLDAFLKAFERTISFRECYDVPSRLPSVLNCASSVILQTLISCISCISGLMAG